MGDKNRYILAMHAADVRAPLLPLQGNHFRFEEDLISGSRVIDVSLKLDENIVHARHEMRRNVLGG